MVSASSTLYRLPRLSTDRFRRCADIPSPAIRRNRRPVARRQLPSSPDRNQFAVVTQLVAVADDLVEATPMLVKKEAARKIRVVVVTRGALSNA